MNSVQIEENVKSLVKQVSSQEISKDDFIYELLLAYGHRKSVVSRVKSGERNLAKTAGEVILKRHLYFKPCTSNLFAEIDALKNSKTVATNKIRFVVVTDFSQLIAIDTKTQDTLDIELGQLAKHFDFFLPWAGMEKMVYRGENPADVKAAEKMADFFDHIKATNYPENATKEQLHEMVVFLNRLLFCFFAEDTKIFSENQFTNLLNQHTQEDGSDLVGVFERLFDVLNTPAHQRNDLPKYLNDFPYVNGGLFKKQIKVPTFDAKARRMLLDSGTLDWSDINPDIFGSMIQGVADPETRSKMGMHYTSVSNIMKLIEPLFLNDLYEEFDKCNDNINKLKKLQVRLSRIKFFDPACGSGNFLIITYKEIRELEIEILKRIRELEGESDSGMMGLFDESHSAIRLDQFYGIELDDFAHEMAILSLWLVEHQMNMVFETEFGYTAPTLPLKQSGRIFHGNAATLDWDYICPNGESDEIYILGNPPYLGQRNQSKEHQKDMDVVFDGIKNYKNLDYISCWFMKASRYINNKSAFAFVTTNSLCQGTQVEMLWPHIFKMNLEISFAYRNIKWTNNAKNSAGVTVSIVGLSKRSNLEKRIYTDSSYLIASNISPYLVEGENLFATKRKSPLASLPNIEGGNQPREGGFLTLSNDEKEKLVSEFPDVDKYIRPLIGSSEFLKNTPRWCIWISKDEYQRAMEIPCLKERIDSVRTLRENGNTVEKNFIDYPYRFVMNKEAKDFSLLIPVVSSERRKYLPVGLLGSEYIVLNSANAIYDGDAYVFGILSSLMHMTWVKSVAGRMRTDIRYTSGVCYNSFPLPELDASNKDELLRLSMDILEARELFPEKNISDLYDPIKMPSELKLAHERLDKYMDSIYGLSGKVMEVDRVATLFKLYADMTEKENA
ncbi:N-6 DNA methylase [Vibrio parahaemolyticus]|uniref:DNA methyltransferase n=4 Tax=Vibrio parahaemolyticus TaxID=670 RepID=UPI001CF18B32|nr:DNA methyltransferase [Vibrio parahaemolyticus]EGR3221762.1 class I SAM-dependent DNA methyltransferase [Vibrio parahaemolyticus]EJC6921331.1 class I SAM-dependent DNA methyltransferase [Vibrio parahaemolyticus]EKL5295266.1 class I SAM-dependent DNA methyltransferase [Vibrio parahaemolyticus]MCA6690426.1 N-6 DNA methylase [Vibrio parahaemolyticus]MDF5584635.1 N-6 DNA methylase [Vibrio parahaemolyticus]